MSELDVSKIKVVFMDIGGIFLTNGWDHVSRQKAAKVFDYDYDKMESLHQFVFYVFEIGHISLDKYLDMTIFSEERNFTRKEFKEFIFSQSQELPEMLAWMKTNKKYMEIPVFALSNESREINDFRIHTFNLHQIFDVFFSSCYLGLRKPDPQIFEKALEMTQRSPSECLYFDDRKKMVETAQKMGFNAVQHQEFGPTRDILEKFIRK